MIAMQGNADLSPSIPIRKSFMISPMAAIPAAGLKASRSLRDGIRVSAPASLGSLDDDTDKLTLSSYWTGHAELPCNVEPVHGFAMRFENRTVAVYAWFSRL